MDVSNQVPVLGAGRFEVRGTLGAGGAGVVYRAFDRQLKREVALKMLRSASGRDLYRFKREFRAIADIVHPNLVALHELHAAGGEWYFTMELVEGVSFIDWVRPSRFASGSGQLRPPTGPTRTRADILSSLVEENRLRGALIQLVDALYALHQAGKLHRDLKPSNVLVTDQGRLALLDFGLVSGLTEDDPERLAVGTPVYMSPEQAADQPLDEASDWYSVGAMVYEALTGRRPFEGDSEQVMTRKQTELPQRPTVTSPLAYDLAKLCMAMLHPLASERPDARAILAELGAQPSDTTETFVRAFPSLACVGRDREVDSLRRALADSRRRSVTVFVRGRGGIGKTTVVRQFLRGLDDAVFSLEGRCFEREAVPFKMLDGMVDVLTGALVGMTPVDVDALAPRDLGSLVRLFPVMRRVPRFAELAQAAPIPADPQEMRRRGFAALRAVMGRLARIKPVVIFIDDAHWGDADSCVFLAELIHNGEPSIIVVLAHRPEDYLGVVAQLHRPPAGSVRRGDVRDLDIGPLRDEAARDLVDELGGDSSRSGALIAAAQGNPLVITELARMPELVPGVTIEDLVRERASQLGPEAQAMLAVSAIAARPLAVDIAARAAGVVGGHIEAQILSEAHLATLRHVGDQMILHPAHDHVRTAVLAALDPELRAGWHEAIARAYEDAAQEGSVMDSQSVVDHWLAAGHGINAAHHAVHAAAIAEEALAFRRASELYDIALAYGPWDAVGRRDLLRRQAQALTCAGQLDEAAQVYGQAAQLLPDAESIDLERLRVEALLRRGRLDEALPAAERLLGAVGVRIPLGTKAARTRMSTQWAQTKLRGLEFTERHASEIAPAELLRIDALYSVASGLAFADPALGRVVQSELIRVAIAAGEPIRACLALAEEVCYAAAAGSRNVAAVDAVAQRLSTLAMRVGHPHVIGIAETSIGIAAYRGGRWRDARTHLEAGLATLREHGAGVRWEIDIGETHWLATLFHAGDWRDMARMTQVLLREAIDRSDVAAQQELRIGTGNLAWLLLGKPDDARAQLDAAELTMSPGFHLQALGAATAAATIDLYRGDAASASRRLDAIAGQLAKSGLDRMQSIRIEHAMLRGRVALAGGVTPATDRSRTVRAIADELDREGAAWATAFAAMLRAANAAFDGATATGSALASLATADEIFAAHGMVGWLHVVRMRRGLLEGGGGGFARSAAARDQLSDLGASDPDAVAKLLLPWPD